MCVCDVLFSGVFFVFFLASQVSHTHTHTEVISSVGRGGGFLFWMPKKNEKNSQKKKKNTEKCGSFFFIFFSFSGSSTPAVGRSGRRLRLHFRVFGSFFFGCVCVCVKNIQ